jgi:ATP-dependent DNA ligase
MPWHNARPRERNPRAPISFIDPCQPTKVDKPPIGDGWAHEIKHGGANPHGLGRRTPIHHECYDWSGRYPRVDLAAAALRRAVVIDAEAVVEDANALPILKPYTVASATPKCSLSASICSCSTAKTCVLSHG